MLWVLIWLSAGSFVAMVLTLRASLAVSSCLLRWGVLHRQPWIGPLLLLVLSDLFEPMEGYNDPEDPLAVVPRIVKWSWLAGMAAAVSHRARYAAIGVLVALHILAVGYILGPGENLLVLGPAERVAWIADKVTFLEAFARGGWLLLWGSTARFPSHVVVDLLLPLTTWLVPACLLLLVGWCWALARSAALSTPGATPPAPIPLRPLPAAMLGAAGALAVVALVLPGPGAVVAADLARMGWLLHLLGTLRWLLARQPRGRYLWLPALIAAAIVVPQAVGLVIGLGGLGLVLWGEGPLRPRRSQRLRYLTHWTAILSAAVVYFTLREVDVRVENPQDARADGQTRSSWVEPRPSGEVATADDAARLCQRRGARVCRLDEWRNALVDHEHHPRRGFHSDGWEWVRLPAGPDEVAGVARLWVAWDEEVTETAALDRLRDAVDAPRPGVRCCR